jgi:hypothetical protein
VVGGASVLLTVAERAVFVDCVLVDVVNALVSGAKRKKLRAVEKNFMILFYFVAKNEES